MTDKERGMRRWLCQIYNQRGGMTDEQWHQFAAFCETYGFMDEPNPGQRKDGRDPWDVFEQAL